jgi:hypothetical protein
MLINQNLGIMKISIALLLSLTSISLTAQKIFPGAQGYGTDSRGAYETTETPAILYVNTLYAGIKQTSDTTGSFEWCISRNYPRIILFLVGGIIDYRGIDDQVVISPSYCNIYGQSAPWPGVIILGCDLAVGGNDILIQHLKVRPGDDASYGNASNRDAISVYGHNVVIDHCSCSWGTDETLAISDKSYNVTASNCIVSHPLKYSANIDESHNNMPGRAGLGVYITASHNVSYIRNLLAYSYDRNPSIVSNNVVVINNFNYISKFIAGPRIYNKNGEILYDSFIGNKVLRTEATSGSWNKPFAKIYSGVNPSSKLYFKDNICQEGIENPENSDWDNVESEVELAEPESSYIDLSEYTILPSENVEDYVLNNAGAFYWSRDSYDQSVIDDVKARIGEYIDSQSPLPARAYNRSIMEGLQTAAGDMRNGHDWSSDNDIIIVNGVQITLNKNCTDQASVLDYLNSLLPADAEAVDHPHLSCYHIIIQSKEKGSGAKITVDGEGLSTFGIVSGTYYGADGVGGWPAYSGTSHNLIIPSNPHGDSDNDGYTNLEEWAYNNCETQDLKVSNTSPVIQDQEITVVNPVNPGTIIGTVEAYDPDQGQSITYSIINGNTDNLYSINSVTGELTVERNTDSDTLRTDILVIRVEDDADISLSGSATVTIKIIPESKIVYIDPTNKNDLLENGSLEHPYDSWADVKWEEDYSYLQKRGTEAFEQKINIESGNVNIGSYGEGVIPKINSSSTDFALRAYEKSNMSITDLNIYAPDAISCIYILGSSCDNNSVQNCVLEGSEDGVRIIDGKNIVCSYNTFKNKGDGIYSYAQYTEIYYNIFTGDQTAINISSSLSEANIYNNVFYNNREAITTSYSQLCLYNNIFYLTNQSDVALKHKTNKLTSDYNIYYPEQEGFINISDEKYDNLYSCKNVLGIDVHSFSNDPMFVDIYNENFQLLPQSPAIDAGRYVGLVKDYTGNSVPDGSAPDIGLFETSKSGDNLLFGNDDSFDEPLIFPNPSNGQFNIDLNNNQPRYSKLQINNIAGTQILQFPISENDYNISIDISNFPSGIYVLNLLNATDILSEMIIVK